MSCAQAVFQVGVETGRRLHVFPIVECLLCHLNVQRLICGERRREGSLRPVGDLSFLPRFIDHDEEAVRDTSSDGLSHAGTVVRGGIGPSTVSSSYQATSEQPPGPSTASSSHHATADQLPFNKGCL